MLRARHLRTGAIAMASNGRKNSSEWEIIKLENYENEEVTLVAPKPKAKAKAKPKAKKAKVAAIPVAAAPTDDDMDGLLDELDT
jgi:hypothetical protein